MTWTSFDLSIIGALLLAAALSDAARRRIPNLIVIPLAATGLAGQLFRGGASGLLSGLLAGAIVFALLWGPWAKGLLGGGDLKLATAAALWLRPGRLPLFLLAGALAGGAAAVVVYAFSATAARREVRQNLALAALTGEVGMLPAGRDARCTVPYAVAVGAGAMIALLWQR